MNKIAIVDRLGLAIPRQHYTESDKVAYSVFEKVCEASGMDEFILVPSKSIENAYLIREYRFNGNRFFSGVSITIEFLKYAYCPDAYIIEMLEEKRSVAKNTTI